MAENFDGELGLELLRRMQRVRKFELADPDLGSDRRASGPGPPVHGSGGGCGGSLRRAARRRLRLVDASRARSCRRQGVGPRGLHGRAARARDRRLSRQGRLDAHGRHVAGDHRRQRHRRGRHPDRRRCCAVVATAGIGSGRRRILRRRRDERGGFPRVHEPGLVLDAAGDLRLREQRLRPDDADGEGDCDDGDVPSAPRRTRCPAGAWTATTPLR